MIFEKKKPNLSNLTRDDPTKRQKAQNVCQFHFIFVKINLEPANTLEKLTAQ